jgi:hypothetical protein
MTIVIINSKEKSGAIALRTIKHTIALRLFAKAPVNSHSNIFVSTLTSK